MPRFSFLALDAAGQPARGEMEATDEAALVRRLQDQGLLPVRAGPAHAAAAPRFRLAPRGLSRGELAEITRELAVMLGAGQDLDRALRFLHETAAHRRVALVLARLRDAIRDGAPLAAAMARQPESFPALHVGLVRAGEAGGALAATLERLAVLLERERGLRATIRSALIYPCFLLLAMIGSVVFLLTEVLPQFVPLFAQNGAALPGATQFLIDAGDFLAANGLALLLALVLAGLAARQALRRPGMRLAADRALLRLPVLGALAREILAARFCRTLGSLLGNGVPLIGALGIARDVLGNRAATQALDRAIEGARGGAGLARPLAGSAIFPARTIHLLRLGEETAELGAMALRAAEIHEDAARLAIQRLVGLLVPVLTIAMGAAVAWIVSSLILAMLSLNNLAT